MYADDITSRVIAMFTFSDNSEPMAAAQLEAEGIKVSKEK